MYGSNHNTQSLRSRGPQRRRAFTLVEILCVLVILGIASAIIIPQMGSRQDLIAGAGARVVMADLIYAQNRAIATQKPVFVQFVGQQYTLMTRDSTASPLYTLTNPVTKDNYAQTLGVRPTPLESVSLSGWSFGGPSVLVFDEMGSPGSYDAGTGTITALTSAGTIGIQSGTYTLDVSIEPYTGEATVAQAP